MFACVSALSEIIITTAGIPRGANLSWFVRPCTYLYANQILGRACQPSYTQKPIAGVRPRPRWGTSGAPTYPLASTPLHDHYIPPKAFVVDSTCR